MDDRLASSGWLWTQSKSDWSQGADSLPAGKITGISCDYGPLPSSQKLNSAATTRAHGVTASKSSRVISWLSSELYELCSDFSVSNSVAKIPIPIGRCSTGEEGSRKGVPIQSVSLYSSSTVSIPITGYQLVALTRSNDCLGS